MEAELEGRGAGSQGKPAASCSWKRQRNRSSLESPKECCQLRPWLEPRDTCIGHLTSRAVRYHICVVEASKLVAVDAAATGH